MGEWPYLTYQEPFGFGSSACWTATSLVLHLLLSDRLDGNAVHGTPEQSTSLTQHTSNTKNYLGQNLVFKWISNWCYIKNCIRRRFPNQTFPLCHTILWALEIYGINIQLHYVKNSVKIVMRNIITTRLCQNLVLSQTQICNVISYVANVLCCSLRPKMPAPKLCWMSRLLQKEVGMGIYKCRRRRVDVLPWVMTDQWPSVQEGLLCIASHILE